MFRGLDVASLAVEFSFCVDIFFGFNLCLWLEMVRFGCGSMEVSRNWFSDGVALFCALHGYDMNLSLEFVFGKVCRA